ncbi:MAG: signal recognition particle protein [Phycisphaerales bacterium]|nr:signal recognition particle protein [Phycisphaerales bacterium]
MFERLSDGFSSVFRRLSGKGEISESNVREAMEDVRKALLEADVHVDVVNDFTQGVMDDAVGREVTKSLKPGEEMIGIVHDRLVEFLGGVPTDDPSKIVQPADGVLRVSPGPTIVMMCGLQGSGKTTTCGKLAGYLKKRGRSVLLVAADLQRPAAVEQLHTVADSVQRDLPGGAQVSFYSEPDKVAAYGKAVGVAVQVCKRGVEFARGKGIDTVILDTAGRLHINDSLMDELNQINKTVHPHQIFLVTDAMTGQDAVNSAKAFHQKLEVDGIVLTKFDSDTRGGAAISVKHVTGAPIKFIGVGEKLENLEDFVPQRIAGRILGMGDVVSLVEKAREQVSDEEAEKLQEKMAKGEMTMDDFLKQLRTLRRMGPLKQLLGLLPGVGSALKDVHIDDKQLDRVEAIVHSMTPGERKKPDGIDMSRRKRIARGSGTDPNEVGQLGKQFTTVSKLAKQMSGLSAMNRVKAVKELGEGGMEGMLPGVGGLPGFGGMGGKGKPSTVGSGFKGRFKKRR